MKDSSVDMRSFYNDALHGSRNSYEHKRWFSSPEREAGYRMTRASILRHVVPLLRPNMHLLEVGAGPGTWTRELLAAEPSISIDILDISDEMLIQAREGLKKFKNVSYQQHDFLSYEPDRKYDFFFSSRAIEYMPEKDRLSETLARSLKSGGGGAIITKFPHYGRSKLLRGKQANVHALQVSPFVLRKQLKKVGFINISVAPVTFVFPKLRSGKLNMLLYVLFNKLPLSYVSPVCESYLVTFERK